MYLGGQNLKFTVVLKINQKKILIINNVINTYLDVSNVYWNSTNILENSAESDLQEYLKLHIYTTRFLCQTLDNNQRKVGILTILKYNFNHGQINYYSSSITIICPWLKQSPSVVVLDNAITV